MYICFGGFRFGAWHTSVFREYLTLSLGFRVLKLRFSTDKQNEAKAQRGVAEDTGPLLHEQFKSGCKYPYISWLLLEKLLSFQSLRILIKIVKNG